MIGAANYRQARHFPASFVCPPDLRKHLLFHAPLTPEHKLSFGGVGAPTFTRNTIATYRDASTSLVTQVAADVPRFERLGCLVEPARTNLFLRSAAPDTAPWSKTRTTVTENAATGPDGTTSAASIHEGADAATDFNVLQAITTTADADLALSVWAKAGNRNWIELHLRESSGAHGASAYFDLTNGVVGTTATLGSGTFTSAKIEDWGSGWYRCVVVGKLAASQTDALPVFYIGEGDNDRTFTGQSQLSLYLWGAQLEEAAFASSHIPTTTASVTRDKDELTFPVLGNWNDAMGTVYFEAAPYHASHGLVTPFAADGGAADRLSIEFEADGDIRAVMRATSTVGDITTTADDVVAGTLKKVAVAYKADDMALYTSGVERGTDTDTSSSVPTPAALNVGMDHGNDEQIAGHIRNLMTFSERLGAFDIARLG